ncbi:hypothetical protein HY993_00185 [Candidatus Micrarchaeota archaeon]|nr:hypothetical protein [Candidatus Micrarchaeota archaeon]
MAEVKVILASVLVAFLLMGCVSNYGNPSTTPSAPAGATLTPSATIAASASASASVASTANPTASESASVNSRDNASALNGVKTIRIDAFNFGFNVTGPQISKGDRVKLIVTSSSGTHGFSLPAFNVDLTPIGVGEEKTAEFTANQSGSFEFFCNLYCGEGHSRMKSTLTVN